MGLAESQSGHNKYFAVESSAEAFIIGVDIERKQVDVDGDEDDAEYDGEGDQ